MLSRRSVLIALASALPGRAQTAVWVCPMDRDVRSATPGKCPRCGMTLVENVPSPVTYDLELKTAPDALTAGSTVQLRYRILDPATGAVITKFEIVHEKIMHLFVVHESLMLFEHIHPQFTDDGWFTIDVKLPFGGMYRIAADYYPTGGIPQVSCETFLVKGMAPMIRPGESLGPFKAENLTATLKLDPSPALATLQSRLLYEPTPLDGLEKYLGAWGHMFVASADLVDVIHTHPFLITPKTDIQFDLVFPRPCLYKIWVQFQRSGVVNTASHVVRVSSI